MSNEDILTQLRAWRDEFARRHGYDLAAMAAELRELDGANGVQVVRGEPRRPVGIAAQGARPQAGVGSTCAAAERGA